MKWREEGEEPVVRLLSARACRHGAPLSALSCRRRCTFATLLDVRCDTETARRKRDADLGLDYELKASLMEVLRLVTELTTLAQSVTNDAVAPAMGDFAVAGMPADRSIAVLRAYEARSRALANIAIEHPADARRTVMQRRDEAAAPFFNGVVIKAVKAIRQGNEMTHTYGACRWASDACRKAVKATRMLGARAGAHVADLSALIDTLIDRAHDDFAAEHGATSLRDFLGCGLGVANEQATMIKEFYRIPRQMMGAAA